MTGGIIMDYASRLINIIQLFVCVCQVTRRLTTELKDVKMARNMEREVQQEKVVSDLKRQLEELNAARERQTELLKTVTDSR